MAELRVTIVRAGADYSTPLLVLPLFERESKLTGIEAEVDKNLGGTIGRVLEQGDFRGRKDDVLVLYARDGGSGPQRVLLVGAGKREDYTAERLRRCIGTAVRSAERMGISSFAVTLAHTDR